MLKLYPANHLWDLEQMAEARRPVRDGQTGVVAGDQPSGNNQQEGQRGNKYGKAMLGGVIRGRGQNYSLEVLIILHCFFLKSRAKREIPIVTTLTPPEL